MVVGQEINFPGWVGGRVGGWRELEIRLSSGQQKLDLGLSWAKKKFFVEACLDTDLS